MTGESPVVDVQTSTAAAGDDDDFVRALPASRGYGNYLAGVPAFRPRGFGAARRPSTTSSPRAADAAAKATSRSTA